MTLFRNQMDRKTLLAFGLIAVVLVLTPWYMSLMSPAEPLVENIPRSRPIDSPVNKKRAIQDPRLQTNVAAPKSVLSAEEKFVNWINYESFS